MDIIFIVKMVSVIALDGFQLQGFRAFFFSLFSPQKILHISKLILCLTHLTANQEKYRFAVIA